MFISIVIETPWMLFCARTFYFRCKPRISGKCFRF